MGHLSFNIKLTKYLVLLTIKNQTAANRKCCWLLHYPLHYCDKLRAGTRTLSVIIGIFAQSVFCHVSHSKLLPNQQKQPACRPWAPPRVPTWPLSQIVQPAHFPAFAALVIAVDCHRWTRPGVTRSRDKRHAPRENDRCISSVYGL